LLKVEITSIDVGRAAMAMAISEDRQDEQEIRQRLNARGISSVAVDFGGEFTICQENY